VVGSLRGKIVAADAKALDEEECGVADCGDEVAKKDACCAGVWSARSVVAT
jgi:hypothetical protein